MRALRRAGIAAVMLLLSACGQRGALFIPEPEREAVVTPQASPVPPAAPATPAADAPAASPSPVASPATPVPATPDPNDPPRRNNGTQRN